MSASSTQSITMITRLTAYIKPWWKKEFSVFVFFYYTFITFLKISRSYMILQEFHSRCCWILDQM
jgi:hypothetical protein